MENLYEQNALGKALSELMELILSAMKEDSPDEYEAFMKWNDKLREQRLAREEKQ